MDLTQDQRALLRLYERAMYTVEDRKRWRDNDCEEAERNEAELRILKSASETLMMSEDSAKILDELIKERERDVNTLRGSVKDWEHDIEEAEEEELALKWALFGTGLDSFSLKDVLEGRKEERQRQTQCFSEGGEND